MSNSLKHAFPGSRKGEIGIVMRQTENGEIDFRFRDNGIGLSEGFDWENSRSLGLKLVRNLAEKQLDGTIELRTGPPTEFRMTFREPLHGKKAKDHCA
jgi:two-component sensor histidine kinase